MIKLVASMIRSNWLRVGLACLTLTCAALAVYVQLGMSFATFYGISRVALDARAPYLIASYSPDSVPGDRSISEAEFQALIASSREIEFEGLLLGVVELSTSKAGAVKQFTARRVSITKDGLSAPQAIDIPTLALLKQPMSVIIPQTLARLTGLSVGDMVQSKAGSLRIVAISNFGSDMAKPIISQETYSAITYRSPERRLQKQDSYRLVFLKPKPGSNIQTISDVRRAIMPLSEKAVFTPASFDRAVIEKGISESSQLKALIVTGLIIVVILSLIISQTLTGIVMSYAPQLNAMMALGISATQLGVSVLIFGCLIALASTLFATVLGFIQRELFLRYDLPIVFLPEFVFVAFALLIVSTTIAAAFAVIGIYKLKPVDLLR